MKLKQFQSYLLQQKIQTCYFVAPDPSITYFTQMEPSHGFLIIMPKSALFLISKLDKEPSIFGIKTIILEKGYEKSLISKKITKVGINKTALTVEQLDKAKKLFPNAKFVDVSDQLGKLRVEKTTKELQLIKKACKITSDAFNAIVKELAKKTLKTEQDAAFFLERYIKSKGATLAFPTICAMGKSAAIPHHITSNSHLRRGFLLMDFGARFNNYCADMTRCVFLGKPTKEEKKYYSLLLNSQQVAINSVTNNIAYSELDKTSRQKLGKFAKYFIHSLGHGIGIEVHENPVFSRNDQIVQKNVPFTIEPGIYIKDKIGLRIEDTLYYDGKTPIILTIATKSLQCVKW